MAASRPGPAEIALGGGPLGADSLSDQDAADLLAFALERGVTLVDTAPSYGASEERIGRFAESHPELRVSTKVGYAVPGVEDWTSRCIHDGVEQARRRLRRDVLDVVHLHSCPREVLVGRGVVEALIDARVRGRVAKIAYSGQGEALEWAVDSGVFDVVQTSVSPVDRRALRAVLPRAKQRGVEVMAKRALASGALGAPRPEDGPDRVEYRRRWGELGLSEALGAERAGACEALIRFAAWQPEVDVVLVGTSSPEHLAAACDAVAAGPLAPELLSRLEATYAEVGAEWPGVI